MEIGEKIGEIINKIGKNRNFHISSIDAACASAQGRSHLFERATHTSDH